MFGLGEFVEVQSVLKPCFIKKKNQISKRSSKAYYFVNLGFI